MCREEQPGRAGGAGEQLGPARCRQDCCAAAAAGEGQRAELSSLPGSLRTRHSQTPPRLSLSSSRWNCRAELLCV